MRTPLWRRLPRALYLRKEREVWRTFGQRHPGGHSSGELGPPLFDATITGVNDNIRSNINKKTTSRGQLLEEDLTLFKSDVSKAHRRIKIRRQVATIKNLFWVNLVGTYGVASAQFYWSRVAALLTRLTWCLWTTFCSGRRQHLADASAHWDLKADADQTSCGGTPHETARHVSPGPLAAGC